MAHLIRLPAPRVVDFGVATVLHVENDAAIRVLIHRLLAEAGHHVIDADNGAEAIRLAEALRPQMVLVDIDAPDLDGYAVTLRLRGMSALEGTPIVALTGDGDHDVSLAVGADGLIQKPIDAGVFPGAIARFLAGHSDRRRREDQGDDGLRSRSEIVKRLERLVVELSDGNKQLEEVARLRREFLQNLSHEFATPMTPVVGYLRLLLNEELGPLTPLQRKCVESINNSTKKLRTLIDTLLDVSHLETGRLHIYARDYDFGDVADKALSETKNRFAEAGIVLVREQSPGPLPARGDPDKLRRAMIHILDNASKFTPRGSEVAVAIRHVKRADGDSRYELVVVDSGPGISERDRERILQPFFQVDGSRTRTHGGVGLGLAYARNVAEALGGGIEVQSPPEMLIAGKKLAGTAIRLTVNPQPPRRDATGSHPTVG
jgi:signal transduction histidine kinase